MLVNTLLRVHEALYWLSRDCLLYLQRDSKNVYCLPLCCLELFLRSRDYRMNVLVRFSAANMLIISFLCRSILFYFYGSTISSSAMIESPLRFSHARSVVIGSNVRFEGSDFVYIFNNVTIGKSSPLVKDRTMPCFFGKCFFGVGSVVLGSVVAEGDIVFGANSFLSDKRVPESSTVVGFGDIKRGVFFENVEFPFVPICCDSLSRFLCFLINQL